MQYVTKLDRPEQSKKSPVIPEEGDIVALTQRIEELRAVIRAAREKLEASSEIEKTLEKQRAVLIFRRDNRTSFVEASEGNKAVLSVTSGLTLPTEPLPTVPTEQKLPPGPSRMLTLHAAKLRCEELHACDNAQNQDTASGTNLQSEINSLKYVASTRCPLIDDGARSMGHPARMLEHGHKHGFIAAVTAAFANHYPLTFKPQHFWLLIAQAVATHVDLNADAVRNSWVKHYRKKTLEVICDNFVFGSPTNDWASVVSGKANSFSAQIAANTLEGVAEVLAPPFSCTTTAEDIAQKIVVMDICKNFFEYRCGTRCGFPQITLQGTTEDWSVLRGATERLLARCKPEFAASWGKALLPLLDKFVAAREGEVDADFWNSLCKRGGRSGSGASTWFNGWMNVFFPYINRKPNIFCTPYSSDAEYISPVGDGVSDYTEYGPRGPDCENFPGGMSRAPVIWEYYRREIKLDFNTGFFGASQDPHTFEISPEIGWYITKAK